MPPAAPPPTAIVLAWLAHPVTVLAAVLLAANDHLFKLPYPGLLTGKLSDVAGLVVAPPVLATVAVLVSHRLPARTAAYGALVVTGVGFTIVKALPAGAAAASAMWSLASGPSAILPDRTDLVALPALGLAGALAAVTRHRPDAAVYWWPGQRTRSRIALLVVLPAAGLAMAATSAPQYPAAVTVVSWRSMIVIGAVDTYRQELDEEPTQQWLSADGGQTWRSLTSTESAAFAVEAPPYAGRSQQQCVPKPLASHCYRVRHGVARGLAVAMVCLSVSVTPMAALGLLHADEWVPRWLAGGLAVATVLVAMGVAVGATVAAVSSGAVRARRAGAIAAIGAATAVGATAPAVLSAQLLIELRPASLAAVACAITGIVLAVIAAERARQDPPQRAPRSDPHPPTRTG